ncbi:uncharacterized protein LOC113129729 isoform X2 [Mastacembelus armatus]|uniref:uncharacterized protein LOC113129729 isoform X2 n=1 Tax=Mastacembelus armatus TaxID=205130 RepID=UPI000E46301A|nr:uncharacterized protein LOC113129729 isoform X2 [Mastacembelus armatus]
MASTKTESEHENSDNYFKTEIKEENQDSSQDPDFVDRDHFDSEIKGESPSPCLVYQDYNKHTIKANRDQCFNEPGDYKSGIKEENHDRNFIDKDHRNNELDSSAFTSDHPVNKRIIYSAPPPALSQHCPEKTSSEFSVHHCSSLTAKRINMSQQPAKHRSCSVVDCNHEHRSLFSVPSSQDTKAQWITFIYSGQVPAKLPKVLYVCGNHFTSNCFENEGVFNAGFASQLRLIPGSIPAVREQSDNLVAPSTSQMQRTMEVACQTVPSVRKVGTQLSLRTLQAHIRSEGTQATVSYRDFGVGTSSPDHQLFLSFTPIKKPSKRPYLELEKEEDTLQESSSMEPSQDLSSSSGCEEL